MSGITSTWSAVEVAATAKLRKDKALDNISCNGDRILYFPEGCFMYYYSIPYQLACSGESLAGNHDSVRVKVQSKAG